MASKKVGFLFLVGIAVCAAASHRIHISRKPSVGHAIRRMLLRAKSGVEPIVSRDGDMFYSGNITVGTPPQTFVTDFDTGSWDLWILDSTCKDDDCKGTPLFQKNQSSTFKSDGELERLEYGGENYVVGVRAYETVTIGELNLKSQPFVLVNESGGNDEVKSLFGLGGRGESGPPFYTAVEQKVVDKPILTVFLEKSADNTFGGEITFGDYDTKNCGPVYAKTESYVDGDWYVGTNSISINGKKVIDQNVLSVVDTGTSFIILPFDITEIIAEIQKKVELKKGKDGVYTLSCADANKIPPLTINIDGYDHVINGTQLAVPDENQCDLGLVSLDFEVAILGDPFIRDRCVSQNIDTKEVSFAHRK